MLPGAPRMDADEYLTSLSAALGDPRRLVALERTGLLDTPAERAFDRLTALTSRELGVPMALITLVTQDRQFFKSACGLPREWAMARQSPLSHSFCQHVVHDRQALVVTDARSDPRLRGNRAIPEAGVVAYAGFPLRTRAGEVLGSFCAFDTAPRTWMAHELELLRDMAATTMDIVDLRGEAVAAADAAGRLQRVLVPEPPKLVRGQAWAAYRPGDMRLLLGGDFYGCAEHGDGSVALVIGDVVGHGPEAAGFAAGLRSAWQALQLTSAPLGEVAARLNQVALNHGVADDRYATVLTARIAPDRRSVELASAGHPPPLLLPHEPADPVRELTVPAGPPLAVMEDATWPVSSAELPADAKLLLYTDGLTEARRDAETRSRLGIEPVLEEVERLRHAGAGGAELLSGLVALAERGAGSGVADDIALLLVRPGD